MKYALIIGNNKYNDAKLAPLKTPEADSHELAKVLRAKNIGNFDEVSLLINPTEAKSRRTISVFLSNKKPDDLVLLYFSGHGVLDGRGSLFLALKDTETRSLNATAISSSFLSYEMDNCRSRRQILILDCCNSGAFARGTKGEQKAITESTFEGSGSGRVVLTASDSTQFALEGDQVVGQTSLSLFTHFLLEGLKTGEADMNNDGRVSLDEWYDYSHAKITAMTPQQIPQKWSYRQQGDVIIAHNPFAKKKKAGFLPDPFRDMLDQKLLDYHQHKLLLDPKELEIVAAELENGKLEVGDADKKLFLFSAVTHGSGHRWLEMSGAKGLEWLRQAYQDEGCPQDVRLGAAAFLGRMEDGPTYDRLLDCFQQEVEAAKQGTWLELLAHYLNSSQQTHRLPWNVNRVVFPRLAWLRVREGSETRARIRKVVSFFVPFCVIIMMVPVYLQASRGPFQPLGYVAITFILGLLGFFIAYFYAEVMTSLPMITRRWPLALQAIMLASMGSIIGIILFYVLSGQKGLWFEGGITGLAQMVVNRKTRQKPMWYSGVTALFAGLLVSAATLQVIDDVRLIEYGAAVSTGLFTAVYTYMSGPTK